MTGAGTWAGPGVGVAWEHGGIVVQWEDDHDHDRRCDEAEAAGVLDVGTWTGAEDLRGTLARVDHIEPAETSRGVVLTVHLVEVESATWHDFHAASW